MDNNDYEILDFGNVKHLENELKIAQTTINKLENKFSELNIQYNSLNIRHTILKAQNNNIKRKITTNTQYRNGNTITTTRCS